jgi:hypothetical protein
MFRVIPSIVAIFVLAPILSYLTAWVVTGHDSSQEATVGDIQLHGFPIWFQENAPGYSIGDGWHPERFGFNTLIWAVVLAVVTLLGLRLLMGKGRRSQTAP